MVAGAAGVVAEVVMLAHRLTSSLALRRSPVAPMAMHRSRHPHAMPLTGVTAGVNGEAEGAIVIMIALAVVATAAVTARRPEAAAAPLHG